MRAGSPLSTQVHSLYYRPLTLTRHTPLGFTVIDALGDAWSSDDPGSSWTLCGDTSGTKDTTIMRANCTTYGNTDWSVEESESTCSWMIKGGQDTHWGKLNTFGGCGVT